MAIDRGSTVFIKNIAFNDESGNAIDGADVTATVELNYPYGNSFAPVDVTLTLDVGTGKFNGAWDSSVADEGWVHGHILGVLAGALDDGGDLKVTKDFSFKLSANRANERT